MGMKLKYITPLLAAGAAAVAIGAAPTAFAANQQSCSGTVCQSPGNVQINAAAPEPDYPYPWDDEFYGPALIMGPNVGPHGGGGGGGGGHR